MAYNLFTLAPDADILLLAESLKNFHPTNNVTHLQFSPAQKCLKGLRSFLGFSCSYGYKFQSFCYGSDLKAPGMY